MVREKTQESAGISRIERWHLNCNCVSGRLQHVDHAGDPPPRWHCPSGNRTRDWSADADLSALVPVDSSYPDVAHTRSLPLSEVPAKLPRSLGESGARGPTSGGFPGDFPRDTGPSSHALQSGIGVEMHAGVPVATRRSKDVEALGTIQWLLEKIITAEIHQLRGERDVVPGDENEIGNVVKRTQVCQQIAPIAIWEACLAD